MIVRLVRPWKTRKVGTVFHDMPDGMGNTLIKRRIAEEVKPAARQEKPKRGRD